MFENDKVIRLGWSFVSDDGKVWKSIDPTDVVYREGLFEEFFVSGDSGHMQVKKDEQLTKSEDTLMKLVRKCLSDLYEPTKGVRIPTAVLRSDGFLRSAKAQ